MKFVSDETSSRVAAPVPTERPTASVHPVVRNARASTASVTPAATTVVVIPETQEEEQLRVMPPETVTSSSDNLSEEEFEMRILTSGNPNSRQNAQRRNNSRLSLSRRRNI